MEGTLATTTKTPKKDSADHKLLASSAQAALEAMASNEKLMMAVAEAAGAGGTIDSG